jgi:hypothetical protein
MGRKKLLRNQIKTSECAINEIAKNPGVVELKHGF